MYLCTQKHKYTPKISFNINNVFKNKNKKLLYIYYNISFVKKLL